MQPFPAPELRTRILRTRGFFWTKWSSTPAIESCIGCQGPPLTICRFSPKSPRVRNQGGTAETKTGRREGDGKKKTWRQFATTVTTFYDILRQFATFYDNFSLFVPLTWNVIKRHKIRHKMSRQFATIYDIFCPVPFVPSPFGFRRDETTERVPGAVEGALSGRWRPWRVHLLSAPQSQCTPSARPPRSSPSTSPLCPVLPQAPHF